ncbi:hypothetical protein H1D32_23610 [Anaerobacillus sp. CMMVII]|uniref:hypothetical protein n=1 Tax=Anaerobacillus sp. CMMVII TaxID=2755588 RepID=UPI0021B84702|nr:hypothetical protein [Anaerobacillus sp. CMMVII]MCT8140420.1 hypothetical protein [Anaerobacillus sp. CMMVII]
MLHVTFLYDGNQPVFETLRRLKFKYENNIYVLTELGYKATINHDSTAKKLHLTFSKELSFEQYKHLHKMIKSIAENIHATVDDHLALMGYLEDGNEAYIYHGWNKWMQFLEGAKHVSMEGQKVQVFNETQLLAEGILLELEKDEDTIDEFKIIKCTIITKTGEKTLTGEHLRIIPTGEF